MPYDIVEPATGGKMALRIGDQRLQHIRAVRWCLRVAEDVAIDARQKIRCLVRGAPQRDAVEVTQVRQPFRDGADAAVENDRQVGVRGLQPDHTAVVERRHVPVLLGRQTLQPGLAGVHHEARAAGGGDERDETLEVGLAVLIVDADAAFDRHRHADAGPHRRDQVGNQLRLGHEAGAEAALLHAIGRAADVEIDLVVAEVLADRGSLGELGWIRAAELQGDGMLLRGEGQQPLARAE